MTEEEKFEKWWTKDGYHLKEGGFKETMKHIWLTARKEMEREAQAKVIRLESRNEELQKRLEIAINGYGKASEKVERLEAELGRKLNEEEEFAQYWISKYGEEWKIFSYLQPHYETGLAAWLERGRREEASLRALREENKIREERLKWWRDHGHRLRNENNKICEYLKTGFCDQDLEAAPALIIEKVSQLEAKLDSLKAPAQSCIRRVSANTT